MNKSVLVLASFLFCSFLQAQDNTFHLTVLGYQWTTTHKTLTFSWPGYANTSCSGSANVNGYVSSGGNISATGTSSDTCSTTYTPPSNQTIDIQKPVVFILAETEDSRMLLTCTRNVRWSQCHALNPGTFLGRTDHGHFEVQGLLGKGKEEWVKFGVVQQTAITRRQAQSPPAPEAPPSIEAPHAGTSGASSGFPIRWKSMTTGSIRTLRFEGDYIYSEMVLPDDAVKAGVFFLMDVKKDGDKYVGKVNGHMVSAGGQACSITSPVELTLVTPDRIEGRTLAPPLNAKIDWNSCSYSAPSEWQTFTWIPVR